MTDGRTDGLTDGSDLMVWSFFAEIKSQEKLKIITGECNETLICQTNEGGNIEIKKTPEKKIQSLIHECEMREKKCVQLSTPINWKKIASEHFAWHTEYEPEPSNKSGRLGSP